MENETQWERNARLVAARVHRRRRPRVRGPDPPAGRRATSAALAGCSTSAAARARSPGGSPALGAEVVGSTRPGHRSRARATRAGGPQLLPRARAEALPFRDARRSTRCVVCAALEHVDDFETAIDEVARVLEPGGRFVLVLCHPLLQAPGSGWIDDRILGEQYWRVGAYLPRRPPVRRGRARRRPAVHPSAAQPLRARDGCGRPRRSTTWRSRRHRTDSSRPTGTFRTRTRSPGCSCCTRRAGSAVRAVGRRRPNRDELPWTRTLQRPACAHRHSGVGLMKPLRIVFLVLGSICALIGLALARRRRRPRLGAHDPARRRRATSRPRTSGSTPAPRRSPPATSTSARPVPDDWWADRDIATVRIRAASATAQPIFIGIARDADVERYLTGVPPRRDHRRRLRPVPRDVPRPRRRRHRDRDAAGRRSGSGSRAATGIGTRTVTWHLRPGHWAVVVMNADGSAAGRAPTSTSA